MGFLYLIYEISRSQTLKEIAALIDCNYVGDADFPVLGMNEIHVVDQEILFL